MGVFPAASGNFLPPTWRKLMTDPVRSLVVFLSVRLCCLAVVWAWLAPSYFRQKNNGDQEGTFLVYCRDSSKILKSDSLNSDVSVRKNISWLSYALVRFFTFLWKPCKTWLGSRYLNSVIWNYSILLNFLFWYSNGRVLPHFMFK